MKGQETNRQRVLIGPCGIETLDNKTFTTFGNSINWTLRNWNVNEGIGSGAFTVLIGPCGIETC